MLFQGFRSDGQHYCDHLEQIAARLAHFEFDLVGL